MGLKQPLLGIVATSIVIAVSLVFVSRFEFPTFAGWVSYALLSIIPMQIVVGITWRSKWPAFARTRPQPLKGLLLICVTLATGLVVGVSYFATVGGWVSPPTPMLVHAAIVSVVVTFWAAIMWGGWPFILMKNPVVAGLSMLVSCYTLNYLLFHLFYNYSFLAGAPAYVPALDPQGMFNALSALVFYVTALSIMFLMLHFDLWPLVKSPRLIEQPVLGIVWTLIALGLGGGLFYVGVNVVGMVPMQFLVAVPIPFIFGTIIVLNMLEGSLFTSLAQPLRGAASATAALVIGLVLAWIYRILAPAVTGALVAGPPAYDLEVWLASALLSVTFPFLVFQAEFFKMWPLAAVETVGESEQ